LSDSKTFKKITSVNLADKPVTDLKYSFYNIHNPKEYLGGGDAVVVEQGPYNLRCVNFLLVQASQDFQIDNGGFLVICSFLLCRKYTVAYDVAQTTSSLTAASQPDPKGTLEYNTANAYLVLDKDVKATSNLLRNADFTLSVAESKATLSTKRLLANQLSMTDIVTNFSPDYLSFLGAMNDEVNMILSLKCTGEQIANIGVNGKAQCSTEELGNVSAANCACCMMDDAFTLATSRNNGVSPAFTNCNSYFSDDGPIMSTLSLLASYDGGAVVKSSGEKKYDGSGSAFTSTSFGQTNIYTALIQSHTINDLMFGYPSAYLGWVAFNAQMARAKKSLTSPLSSTDLSKRMLTGQMDANLSLKLGNMADYTSKVGSVCYATCLKNGNCAGYAPERHETSDVDKVKLGGIECKPYTSAFETVAKCTATNAALQLNANAPGYEACVCANGSDEWSSKGCCLAAGKYNGSNLRGEGCLFEVAGIVDPNYSGMDASSANTVDLGKALRSWMEREEPNSASEFMCPAVGTSLDEHKKFGYYESYDGSKGHVTYYHTGNDRMRQNDIVDPASKEYVSAVTGGSGKYFAPKGLTVKVGASQISDGIPQNVTRPVYVPDAMKPIDFAFEGIRNNGVRNQICGRNTCIVSARLRPIATAFNVNKAVADGAGLPFDGLQPVGHMTGRPEYLHHPLFLNGDTKLYTQQNNSYAGTVDGNGIKIYRPSSTSASPGAFDPSNIGSKYKLVDKAYVDAQKDTLLSHIDIEVATGLAARQRMRFGASYSIWECDPSTNANCKLAVNSKGADSCYGTAGAATFEAMATADKNDLKSLGRNNMTYPCSAANMFTPHVVGGKILPMYWYEGSTIHATVDDVDVLVAYSASYQSAGTTVVLTCSLVAMFAFLGVCMLLLCLCFERKHSFMEGEKLIPTTQPAKVA
jgi:hypothetical protein